MKRNKLAIASCLILAMMTIIMLLVSSCQTAEKTTTTTTTTKPVVTSTTPTVTTTTPPTTTATTTSAPTAVHPSPTGTLKVAMADLADETFLPWNGAAGRKFYVDTINEYLIYLDPATRTATPGLATSWQMSPDGKTWTIKLRQGVQWQENNGEFTSADVQYTFQRIMEPTSMASQASTFRSELSSIDTPDKYTAVFNLKTPDFFLWSKLSNQISNFIVCKAYVTKVGDAAADAHPIGTGPYTLADHKKGVSITVTTIPGVETQWRVTPQYKTIVFYGVPEESTRVAMLKAGEADMAPISMDSVDSVKAVKFQILSIDSMWAPRIVFGGLVQTDPARYNASAPWAQQSVRQALNYAVDKNAIAQTIFHGQATANFHPFLFTTLPAPVYPYDVAKAKQLIAAAGYPNGFPVTLYTCPRNPGAQLPDIGLAVATYWQAVGVSVKVIPTDYPTIRAMWNAGKDTNMFFTHIASPPLSPDDSGTLTAGYTDKSVFATFTSTQLDTMANAALNEPDVAKRTTDMANIYNYLIDQADYLYLTSVNEPYATGPGIATWPTIFAYPTNFDSITKVK